MTRVGYELARLVDRVTYWHRLRNWRETYRLRRDQRDRLGWPEYRTWREDDREFWRSLAPARRMGWVRWLLAALFAPQVFVAGFFLGVLFDVPPVLCLAGVAVGLALIAAGLSPMLRRRPPDEPVTESGVPAAVGGEVR